MTSFPDLDERLREAAARTRRADHLRRQRAATADQIRQAHDTLTELERELAREEHDVSRLEGGLPAALARLLGNREERLARERAEAAAAAQRVEGHRARLAQLDADARAAEAELAELEGAPEEYAGLLAEKERLLISGGDPRARELADIDAGLRRVAADTREHTEAHRAGRAAQDALGEVLRHLTSARRASTWDLFGGGLIADSIEHDRLRTADQAAWHAQRALDVFSRELADVGLAAQPRLPKVDTRWFVDTFFDNIITDAIKHQRIENTRAEVEKTARWVHDTSTLMNNRCAQLLAERERLLSRRERLLSA
ncbi:hypothetical protein HTZ77_41955 [Nonomuraea sp. SMC257]|uniref:Uncharacterized protein n=1 Tax=Nonomuraea montanisoli TaxID=2741721 RepID=A0A7Y6IGN4_9ACTN|nr:hypothetical protein [Nonomuraea montanisoli]NUW37918.1 hypothetical protein [Nonomuraea montanisoli]